MQQVNLIFSPALLNTSLFNWHCQGDTKDFIGKRIILALPRLIFLWKVTKKPFIKCKYKEVKIYTSSNGNNNKSCPISP